MLQQLDVINPKIVLALGDSATKSILDIKYKNFSEVGGKEFCLDNIIVIPIYHPGPISPKSYDENLGIFENLKKYVGEI